MELFDDLLTGSFDGNYHLIRQVIVSFLIKKTKASVVMEGERKGKENIIALFGENPELLINCHIDTVSPQGDWKYSPCQLTVQEDKAYGLGTADTKGNIFALLQASANVPPQNCLFLFSVDEESGGIESGVSWFLQSSYKKNIKNAVICEPTELEFVYRHPGYCSFEIIFSGETGHSSDKNKMDSIENAAKAALVLKKNDYHLGLIEGGKSGNTAASNAVLRVSKRSFQTPSILQEEIINLLKDIPGKRLNPRMLGPSFSNPLGLPDFNLTGNKEAGFWTEAALFQEAGVSSLVFGAGSIKQAHKQDEFVSLEQLKGCQLFFENLFRGNQ